MTALKISKVSLARPFFLLELPDAVSRMANRFLF